MRRLLSPVALLFLVGCAQLPWRARGVPVPVERAGEALAQVARGAEQRTSLRAKGRLELDAPAGDRRVDEIVLAQRPDQLRLESLSPLGQALTVLVTDGERYGFFDGARLESGALEASTLRERIGLALEPREAVELLLAAPAAASASPRAAFRDGSELWVVLDGWRLGIDPGGELAALEALDRRGKLRWRARYLGWRDVPGGRYPESLSIQFPRARVEARLRLSRVELNAALAPERFRVPEPVP
jgi:outer membrane biogenesis lipoprotein LolB